MRKFVLYLGFVFLSTMAVSCAGIFESGSIEKLEIPDRALFIGNSLLLGNGTFGMNATDSEHDYHAIIQRKFLKVNPAYTDVKLSGVDFEACESQSQQEAWLEGTLRPVLRGDLDLVVIQLGDNVNTSKKKDVFERGAKSLIGMIKDYAPRAHVVWIYGWYSSSSVAKSITNACKQYGVTRVGITDLNTADNESSIGTVVTLAEPTTQALNYTRYTQLSGSRLQIEFDVHGENYSAIVRVMDYNDDVESHTLTWRGYEMVTTDKDIASHPGNRGFEAIAQRFCEILSIDIK